MGKPERDIFERDMERFVEMNNFFDHDFKLQVLPAKNICKI